MRATMTIGKHINMTKTIQMNNTSNELVIDASKLVEMKETEAEAEAKIEIITTEMETEINITPVAVIIIMNHIHTKDKVDNLTMVDQQTGKGEEQYMIIVVSINGQQIKEKTEMAEIVEIVEIAEITEVTEAAGAIEVIEVIEHLLLQTNLIRGHLVHNINIKVILHDMVMFHDMVLLLLHQEVQGGGVVVAVLVVVVVVQCLVE